MILKIIDIFIYAGIVQGFFLAFVLLRANRALQSQNRMLSGLLIVLSCAIIHSVFVAPSLTHVIGNPIKIKEPFILLIGPMLYFYAEKLFGLDTGMGTRSLLHGIPFLLFFALNLPFFIHNQDSPYSKFFIDHSPTITIVVWILIIEQYGAYLWAISRITHRFLGKAREEFSNLEELDPSWVRFFMVIFLIILVFLMVVLFSLIHLGGFLEFERVISLLFSLSIFGLGYKGLFQKGLFPQPAETAAELMPMDVPLTATYKNEEGIERLIKFIDETKPYLDPDLTLTQLADALGLGRNQLSEMINAGLGINFYDFINKYRVEEVKHLLDDRKKQHIKIIAIAFEAGFPSKSSFNNIFKKYTGLTPSEYRNILQ
jgi:AraC-like DNA-binding protein